MTGNVYQRQWGILVAAMMLLGGALGWNLYATHASVESREQERLTLQAAVVEKNVVPQMFLANRVIDRIIGRLPDWRANKGNLAHANTELQLINDTLIGIRPILVLDAQGTVILSTDTTLIGRNFAEREYFQSALRSSDPTILHLSAPFKTVLDTYVISMYRVIPGPQGGFGGIVLVSAVPEFFTTLLDSVRYAEDMRVALIHGDGKLFVVAPPRHDMEGVNIAIPGTMFMRHLESRRKTSVMSGRLQSTGELRMVALRTIQPDQLNMDKPLVMSLNRDFESIFTTWRRGASAQVQVYLLLVVVCVFGLFLYQRKSRETEKLKTDQQADRDQAEINFNAVFEFSPVPLGLHDAQENIVYVNSAFQKTFGYTLNHIRTLTEWYAKAYPDPAYRLKVQEGWQSYLAQGSKQVGGVTPIEVDIRCLDGSIRSVLTEASPIVFPQGVSYLVSFYDISERKAAENAVQLSNNLLQATLDAIPDLLFEVDGSGRIHNYHAQRRDLLAAPPEVFLGKTFSEVLPPGPAQTCLAAIQEAATQGWASGYEYLLHLPQGDFWFELSVAPMQQIPGRERHFVALARDVSERKRLREQMLAFLENSAVVAYIMDEATRRYTFISNNYSRTFGLTSEQIIGKTNHEIWPQEIAEAYERTNQKVRDQGGLMESIEPGPMNDSSWWLSNKFLFQDVQGKTMLGGLSVNISIRIHDEEERLEKERTLRNTLVREVHHRIKNNLQSVAGLLRRELGRFTESQPRLEAAISQVNAIAVIHGLQGVENRESTRLHVMVASICKSVADLRQCAIEFLEPPLDSDVRSIEIDKDEAVSLALVINELILNAIKHAPEGTAPQVMLNLLADGARLVIRNATMAAPAFDIKTGEGISTGLKLVRSLLPDRGAELTYQIDAPGWLSARLTLTPPTITGLPQEVSWSEEVSGG